MEGDSDCRQERHLTFLSHQLLVYFSNLCKCEETQWAQKQAIVVQRTDAQSIWSRQSHLPQKELHQLPYHCRWIWKSETTDCNFSCSGFPSLTTLWEESNSVQSSLGRDSNPGLRLCVIHFNSYIPKNSSHSLSLKREINGLSILSGIRKRSGWKEKRRKKRHLLLPLF